MSADFEIKIRQETPADYRAIEELTREAFWGAMDHPTCDGEHLLVHKLRKLPAFVEELDFVAEADGKLIGHVIYSLAKVITPGGDEVEVLNFGPLSVLPAYRKKGIGSALMRHSIAEAIRLGYRAIIFYGHPDYYPRFGFRRAERYGITSESGDSFDALMAMELYDGALQGVKGKFVEDSVYQVDPAEMAEFEKGFALREPVRLMSIGILTGRLPVAAQEAFRKRKIRYVAQLHRYSGAEMLRWEGIDEDVLAQINGILSELGYSRKLFPTSYILQLAEMNVRNPRCALLRTKAGISLYRVESEGKRYVLKTFDRQEDAREIENYRLLSALGVPTLPLLAATQNAILLPDVNASDVYRLGIREDLDNVCVARALARWYKTLHEKGASWLAGREIDMYDETDVVTPDNMRKVARRTGTEANPLWAEFARCADRLRMRIDALPRTLTYNDFYYTNLIVEKNMESAFMFDYNLLGKGMAYGDIRNVTCALSAEAAAAFVEEYGVDGLTAQKEADAVLSPLVTLFFACEQEEFPGWAKGALAALENGDILKHLQSWKISGM